MVGIHMGDMDHTFFCFSPLSIFHPMNLELALQLLSTTAVIAVGPAVVVLLFLQKGNL